MLKCLTTVVCEVLIDLCICLHLFFTEKGTKTSSTSETETSSNQASSMTNKVERNLKEFSRTTLTNIQYSIARPTITAPTFEIKL